MRAGKIKKSDWEKAVKLLSLRSDFDLKTVTDFRQAMANWKELTIYARNSGDDSRAAELSWAKEIMRFKWGIQSGRRCSCGKRKYAKAAVCPECRLKSPSYPAQLALSKGYGPKFRQVLKMRTEGMKFEAIAKVLGISRKGVEYHWRQIQLITGLEDLALLTQFGLRYGLTEWKIAKERPRLAGQDDIYNVRWGGFLRGINGNKFSGKELAEYGRTRGLPSDKMQSRVDRILRFWLMKGMIKRIENGFFCKNGSQIPIHNLPAAWQPHGEPPAPGKLPAG